MYTKNELMFPHYAIPHLRDARGEAWQNLIDRISALPETHEEVLAFMLAMIRLNGCMPCETDSYRAMRRFKEPDDELLLMYEEALADIQAYLTQGRVPALAMDLVLEGV